MNKLPQTTAARSSRVVRERDISLLLSDGGKERSEDIGERWEERRGEDSQGVR